jgi:glycosyltransferase involved in cell wall biosynthesis
MKNILFVINTLGRAGAETALLELLRRIDPRTCRVSLYVLTNQGEMVAELPPHVQLLNRNYCDSSVLTGSGRLQLMKQLLRKMVSRNALGKNLGDLLVRFFRMVREGKIRWDKLLWRVVSDGSEIFPEEYDLAVAFLEGGSTYYVADHVKARKKAAFVHIDYSRAGYTREMDKNCYEKMDRIFTVSEEVSGTFLAVYPELADRVCVFHNLIDWDRVRSLSRQEGGFADGWSGIRVLTVGRLTGQKALDLSVQAMKLLKDQGIRARWYVLGEGEERSSLTRLIRKLGLEQEFVLLGSSDNPYPYFRQADIYVHASRHEGKSIAVQEAICLGCPVVLSDCSGNREQITDGVDGVLCELTAESIAEKVNLLIRDADLRKRYSQAAAARTAATTGKQVEMLLKLCDRE